jgi:N6-L-threonylcarbamoyladenine synthase
VIAGGVASNRFLRHVLRGTLAARGHAGLPVICPPAALCTDNAAMIAWAGAEMYEAGWRSSLRVGPIKKWSMDDSDGSADGGIMGVEGWLRRDDMAAAE